MLKSHHTHVYHLTRLGEMKKLFWERSFDSFGTSLVGIFIPVYLLRLHYSLSAVMFYQLLIGLFMLVINPVTFRLIIRLGANHTMVLGNIGYVLFYLSLLTLPSMHWPLVLVALLRAVNSSVYYPAFHANFIAARLHRRTGHQLGLLNAMSLALGGLAPAVGGLIAVGFGLSWSYAVAAVAIVIGTLPLLKGEEYLHNITFRPRELLRLKADKDFIANGLYGVGGFIESVVWPLLISLFIASYASIGLLGSVILVSSIAISLYAGRKQDNVGERPFIDAGIGTNLIGNLGRIFTATPVGIFGVNLFTGVSDAMLSNAFIGRYYKNADQEYMLEYMFGMEMMHALIWVGYFALIWAVSLIVSVKLTLLLAIIIGIPSVLGVRLIKQAG